MSHYPAVRKMGVTLTRQSSPGARSINNNELTFRSMRRDLTRAVPRPLRTKSHGSAPGCRFPGSPFAARCDHLSRLHPEFSDDHFEAMAEAKRFRFHKSSRHRPPPPKAERDHGNHS